DDPILAAEFGERIVRRLLAGKPRDGRVQPASGDHQQRIARTFFLVMDANGASFIKAHGGSSLCLCQHFRRCGHCGCGDPGGQYVASRGIDHRCLPGVVYVFTGSPILSCVCVSKSLASWRSWSWLAGSPEMRLTMRPRFTAGRLAIWSVQRCTFLYSCTDRNSPPPYSKPFASAPYHGHVTISAIV